ncbi:hypothetical protein HRG_005559 [Hirsutella rhossiliensis]|uniref:Uncharacterized protein n=1 Tax=Hirsutella rhossiliensis TaxID=111463 RepID=A0A9P8SID1_9HYPO|nr:uncharacterized protein HRG_05559 [Hirsutella rhossiliensis]KAH0963049.1 hypothetical protein HRG_05559 [Hirsutella rhossiliensis]
MTLVAHRFRRCVGWNCLTEAQKTGIIVSIAVVAVAFFLAYMHCLGKAAISRRERASVRLPGGRRVPHPQGQLQSVVVAQLPVAQQWPGGPAMIAYQPALFTVQGAHHAMAQPVMVAGSYPRPPLATMNPVPPTRQQHDHQEDFLPDATRAGDGPEPAPQAAPDSPPSSLRRHRQPTWRQILSRALRLPVGRASTIESVSAPGTPSRIESHEGMHSARPLEEAGRERVSVPPIASGENRGYQTPPLRTSGGSDEAAGETDSSSLRTNVAVVHSDDFQMVDPSSRITQQPGKLQVQGS